MANKGEQLANKLMVLELYRMKWNKPDLTFKELLLELYVKQNMTQKQMGKLLHRSTGTINNWLDAEGIPGKVQVWS